MHYKATIVLAAAGVASASTVLPYKRALTSGWASNGCYNDYWDRALANQVTVSGSMTAEKCVAKCDASGYTFAGAEGTECWCDNKINTSGTAGNKVADGDCSTNCPGSSSQKCGAGWRLSVYKKTVAATPFTPPSGWASQGCYTDSWTRTLSNSVSVNGAFTMTGCINACSAAGYSLAGAEAGSECWCSNATPASNLKAADGDCASPCSGKSSETCGGGWRLSTYKKTTTGGGGTTTPPATYTPPTGWSSAGCYSDSWTRTLGGPSTTSSSLTADNCINSCNTQGYKFAGMEAGNECYCANSIGSGGVKQSSDSACATPCTGNSAQTCGGAWLLTIYQKDGTTTTPGGGTTTPPTNTDYPGKADGWTNEGCYNDAASRTLTGSNSQSGSQTVEGCQATCYAQKFKYAALEAGNECFCGDSLPSNKKASDASCTTPCTGNGKEVCGGGWLLSVYSKPPATSGPSTFEKVGCFVDNSGARFLRDYTPNLGNSNSPDACISACSAKGYGYAGVEYGAECYCGDQLWNVQAKDESECNVMNCPGDSSKKCGNGNRIMLYQDTIGWCS